MLEFLWYCFRFHSTDQFIHWPFADSQGEYNRPVVLMTAAEIQFALAEAKQRFTGVSIAGTAQSFYEEGVKQSFRLLGAPNAAVTTLLSSGIENADWSASSDKIKAINHQKWIAAVNFEGLEAWTEYRKITTPIYPRQLL